LGRLWRTSARVDAVASGTVGLVKPVACVDRGDLEWHGVRDEAVALRISNGLPGGMPAFSQLSETDRWNLVNYLRSVNGRTPSARAPTDPAMAVVLPLGLPLVWMLLGIGIGWHGWRHRRRADRGSRSQR
jgi:hypothetical protein